MLILAFIGLQILDAITTWWFLQHGVREANPMMRALFSCFQPAVVSLSLTKCAGIVLGLVCWRSGRQRLLARMNVFYFGVILWNLIAIMLSVP